MAKLLMMQMKSQNGKKRTANKQQRIKSKGYSLGVPFFNALLAYLLAYFKLKIAVL